ncbi:MAG: enoyl-CoA hydratase/isomerase family protein [Acidobacteria bacterium]|nr:enoyl-CoA hydratase/isomerase family protein [Acidobacteriota bacterium]
MIETIDHGAVRELRMAHPPANALSPRLIVALSAALAQAAGAASAAPAIDSAAGSPAGRGEQPAVAGPAAASAAGGGGRPAGLVLSGAPGMFSAGLDVPYLLTLDREGIRGLWSAFYALLRGLAASPLPVVAAITGHSPAGGAVLALYCDLRVMAAGEFRIGLNEVRVGLPVPPVIVAAMRRLVGPRLAERMCVSGALVPPQEALQIGLVDEVAPPEQVVERAVARAAELAALPRAAMTETRRLARADLVALFAAADAEMESLLDSWFSAEAQATMHALVERLARKSGSRHA